MLTKASDVPESKVPHDGDDSDFIAIQRMAPVKIGKWRILPPEAEESERASQAAASTSTAESAVAAVNDGPRRPDRGKNQKATAH